MEIKKVFYVFFFQPDMSSGQLNYYYGGYKKLLWINYIFKFSDITDDEIRPDSL